MQPTPKYSRAVALDAAREIIGRLQPLCERLVVAGSLRRRAQQVSDMEILYIPKFEADKKDLFKEDSIDLVSQELEAMLAEGIIEKRPSLTGNAMWGNLNKFAIDRATGIPIDFFRTNEDSWFNYLVCRTGSALNNTRIATAALAKGLKWTPYGPGFTGQDGKVHPVHSEKDVYRLVGMTYLEPWQR